MRSKDINIAIAGCGPSGLCAAILLNSQGHSVTLFERFDKPQPVGSGIILQPTGLAVLNAMNLGRPMAQRGHRIDALIGHSMPRHKLVLNVDYQALGQNVHGLAVHRAALFETLYERVGTLNIPVHTNCEIERLEHQQDSVVLIDSRGNRHGNYDLCIDATGANSALHPLAATPPNRRLLRYGAIWASLDWPESPFEPHILHQRYVAAHTMIGVLPMGRHSGADREQAAFFWSLRSQDYPAWKANGLDAWKSTVRSIWPETEGLLDQIQTADQFSQARYGHHTLKKPSGHRLAFIGDSAHATSPQLGQGANMGLLDGWAISQALAMIDSDRTTNQSIEYALDQYASLRRFHVRLFQLASLSLTPFYQSDSTTLAALRDALFDPMSRLPGVRRIVAGLVTGMLTNPLKKLNL